MKLLSIAFSLTFTFLSGFSHGADAPYEILVVEATFEGVKPITVATRCGEKGEITVGTKKEFDFGHVFFGRRLRIRDSIDADMKGGGTKVQLTYEDLDEPQFSKESGVMTQPSKTLSIVVDLDGREKLIDLGGGKTLKLKLTAVGSFTNKVEIEEDAGGKPVPSADSK